MSEEKFQLPTVKLAGGVEYDGANDLWRFTVASPEELAAALIGGSALRSVLDTQSQDDAAIRDLIGEHFERVERWVATAEVNKWPDGMGVFPEWKPGKEP
jgi:hypothetical protein